MYMYVQILKAVMVCLKYLMHITSGVHSILDFVRSTTFSYCYYIIGRRVFVLTYTTSARVYLRNKKFVHSVYIPSFHYTCKIELV